MKKYAVKIAKMTSKMGKITTKRYENGCFKNRKLYKVYRFCKRWWWKL